MPKSKKAVESKRAENDGLNHTTQKLSPLKDEFNYSTTEKFILNEERMTALTEAFQSVINKDPLAKSLKIISRLAKREMEGTARTAFYIVNAECTHLYTIRGAGNMADEYADDIDGFLIGLDSLSCGLAVPTGKNVITSDVREEPLWKPRLHLAEKYNFRGCWSFPIKTNADKTVGTFAMYFEEPREATPQDIELAGIVTQIAALIITNYNEIHQRELVEAESLVNTEDARLLQQISTRIIQGGDIHLLYDELLQSAIAILHAEMSSIQILDPEKNELYLQSYRNFHPRTALAWEFIKINPATSGGRAFMNGERVIIPDIEMEPGLSEKDLKAYDLSGIVAMQSTVLISRGGKLLGLFSTYWDHAHQPSERELSLFDVLARQVSDLIERNQADEALRIKDELIAQELSGTRVLHHLSKIVVEDISNDSLYRQILEAAVSLMHSDLGSIQTLDVEKDLLNLQAHKNFHPQSAAYWQTVTAGSGSVCGAALRSHSRITVNDIEKETFAKNELAIFRLSGIRAVQSTPLISSNGRITGMLNTQWKQPRNFTDEDFRFFDVLARQAADLMERKQTGDELKQFNQRLEYEVGERTAELKQSQEKLLESNKQLIHSVEQLESFNYIASHDLQEPLRKVQTFANLLAEQNFGDEELDSFIKGINDASTRMRDLIDSLLTYSRTSCKQDAWQATDLNTILEAVLSDFEIIIKEKEANITSDKLPVINAIPFQVHQLFSNLISNSLKFNERKPEINITCRTVLGKEIVFKNGFNPGQSFVELKVKDNGIGFDNEYREKIFQVFQRLHTKAKYSGTGIGLSIVERIIKNHNGHISATGEKGKGAEFTIYLPV